jgi:hypothetical protein
MTEQLTKAIEDIPALGQIDAAELADNISDGYIDQLQRDPALPRRTALEWRLLLAKPHEFTVECIHARIFDHIDREDALRAAEWES